MKQMPYCKPTSNGHYWTQLSHLVRSIWPLLKMYNAYWYNSAAISYTLGVCYNDPFWSISSWIRHGVMRYMQLLNVSNDCSAVMGCLNLKVKALGALETLDTKHPVTCHHIPQEVNLQQHCCMYLRSRHRTYSFMEKVHYSEFNSSVGHKITSFFVAIRSSRSCSEGCITSPCPQPDDPIPTKLGNVHTSSAHSFYCQPQIQNLIKILLFILAIKQKNRQLRSHCSIMLWHVTWSVGNNTHCNIPKDEASYVPPNVGTRLL
jgi:hypothetical protein